MLQLKSAFLASLEKEEYNIQYQDQQTNPQAKLRLQTSQHAPDHDRLGSAGDAGGCWGMLGDAQ